MSELERERGEEKGKREYEGRGVFRAQEKMTWEPWREEWMVEEEKRNGGNQGIRKRG
jgi:hypothetical protein